ncbi:HEAT repeat domain-containing protein [Streptomyces omiyaensis]|uniref:HEAT repeat domain-containing protein n=1 Tax=Streptomyces omiyaensis TaxID=68247 RepID=UPI0036FB247A
MSTTSHAQPNPRRSPEPAPAGPEAALALAAAEGGPPSGWRAWPGEVLRPSVRVALLRAELVREPEVLRREERGEELYQAVRAVEAAAVPRPEALLGALAGSGDAVLEGEALRLAREALRAGAVAPVPVRRVLTGLLGSAHAPVVRGALAELTEPWAAVEPLPAARFAALLAPATAGAALAAAAAHGHGDVLREAARDPGLAPRVRARALALYGDAARRGDVPAVLETAGEDPLLLGGPAVDCLRALHRRGHFVTGPDVPAVLALALADHTIPARSVATVLFTERHALLRLLLDAAPDDPAWPRRLDLLVALGEQGVGGLPVAAGIARLLPRAARPGPFLRALRALRDPGTEDAVLAALPDAPAEALDALEALGGERTVRVLGAALGLAPAGRAWAEAGPGAVPEHGLAPEAGPEAGSEPRPERVERALRAFPHRVLDLVWMLNTDPGVRRELLARVDPARMPVRMLTDLCGPDERELALLVAHVDPEDPVAAVRLLAPRAGPGLLPVLADLLLRIAGDAAAAWEPDGPRPVPDAEPRVPEEVVEALARVGRSLHGRARIRPVCLLDAFGAEAGGAALVTDLALGLLDRPDLTTGERTVLLRLLLDLPGAPHHVIRPRVHALLRDPDRHVRKHVVALLARDGGGCGGGDGGGGGVEAVSATLLSLLGPDRDPQTVRATLNALGDAGARWAAEAIADCLDHPQANVRKTAARALATAGSPRAVPHLLRRLARDDNPGLRVLLVDALRALLGDTLTATVTAAADRAADAPARGRLLAAIAAGPGPGRDDTDLRRLTEDGWDPAAALRLVAPRAPGARRTVRLGATRPHLSDWLELAAAAERDRRTVLAVLPAEVCPAPRTAHERDVLARHLPVLLAGLAEAEGEARDGLLGLLEEVAGRAAVGPDVVAAVRALPPRRPGRRSTLPLLGRAGAVLVRADLDRELAAAALDPDPPRASARVLRGAFGPARPAAGRPPWRAGLVDAARSPGAFAEHRARNGAVGSRDLIGALVEAYADAAPDVRAALVDRMTELQPLDAPRWTLAEDARAADSVPRDVRPADLDQPRSAAQRERLLALLDSDAPERRNAAARTLLAWPEPETRAAVLHAYLRGRADEPAEQALRTGLGHALAEAAPALLREPGVLPGRVARIAATSLDAERIPPLLPVLLDLWRHGPADARADASAALRRLPADALAACLESELAAGAVGLLDLLAGRRLRRTPLLERLDAQHPGARLALVDGPVHGPGAAARQEAALRTLRERAPAPVPTASSSSYEEQAALLRSPEPRRVRRALARLTEGSVVLEPALLEGELRALLDHPETGVRLHAHRTSRALLDRDTHLRLTEALLDDPAPDVVRGAVRVLSGARWRPAVPAFVALLDHGRPAVRRAAEEAVLRAGAEAVPALRRAVAHARPDRRAGYAALLARVREAERP